MAKDLRNILLSEIEENKIKEKTPDKLPLNPTAAGWSGQEVRRFLAKSLIDNEGSFLSEFKKKMIEIKAQFEDVFGDGDGNIQGQIDSIIQDIAAIEDHDVSELARTVSDNYNTLNDIKVNKTLTILGIDLQDDITLSEFKIALGDATTFTNGLMSALDKENLAQTIVDIQNLFSNKADKTDIPTNVSQLNNDTGYITGYTETDPIFTAWDKSTGISITKSQVSDLIEATQALSGLMSSTDKQRLDVLHALLEEDTENNVVDSINEVLAIFNNYPEGADLVSALAGKVDKVSGKGLSTNDYTNTDKNKVDNIDQVYTSTEKIKLAGIEAGAEKNVGVEFTQLEKSKLATIEQGAEKNTVNSVNGKQGVVVLNQDNVGDGATYKQVSQAEKNTWNNKQDKLVAGDNITIDENTNVISASVETDPIFTAWDKSTGINITKSQVSDFSHTHNDLYYDKDYIDNLDLSGVEYKGAWVNGSNYKKGDIVYSNENDDTKGFVYLFHTDKNNSTLLPETIDGFCINLNAFTNKAKRIKLPDYSGGATTKGALVATHPSSTYYGDGDQEHRKTFYLDDIYWLKDANGNFHLYDSRGKLASISELFSGSYNDLTDKPTLFSGNYDDLTNKPTIPTKTSDLTNDSGFATETWVTQKVSSVYKYKGSVATYSNLPTTGLTIGDVYDIQSNGMNYAWTGTSWDALGMTIDLSNYHTKNEIATILLDYLKNKGTVVINPANNVSDPILKLKLLADESSKIEFTNEDNGQIAKQKMVSKGNELNIKVPKINTGYTEFDTTVAGFKAITKSNDNTNKRTIFFDNDLWTPDTLLRLGRPLSPFGKAYIEKINNITIPSILDSESDTLAKLSDLASYTKFKGNYTGTTTYKKDEIVKSNNYYYISLQDNNSGNTPNTSPTFWANLNEYADKSALVNILKRTSLVEKRKVLFGNANGYETPLFYDGIYQEDGELYDSRGKLASQNDITDVITENITHANLKTKVANSELFPNRKYRIIDYETTGSNVAGHLFDIVLQASSSNTFYEVASAVERSGETYFANRNAKLYEWQIWYDINGNGKGEIIRMIDEHGNDLPFDFKNMLFRRYKATSVDVPNMATELAYLVGTYYATQDETPIFSFDLDDYKDFYTFSHYVNGVFVDGSLYSKARKNKITNSESQPNYSVDNIFFGYAGGNTIHNSRYNTFIGVTTANDFNGVAANVFGDGCNYNKIFGKFFENYIGSNFENNIFDNGTHNCNMIKKDFKKNTISGGSSFFNKIDEGFEKNNAVSVWQSTFGKNIKWNNFNNGIKQVILVSGVKYNVFNKSLEYVKIDYTPQTNDEVKNIIVDCELKGVAPNHINLYFTGLENRTYKTTYDLASNGNIVAVHQANNVKRLGKYLNDNTDTTWKDIPDTSGGGGEVDLNEMAYFDYAGSIYGAKYNLLASAWEHSLTVDPLEISEDSGVFNNPRGMAQYPNGETEGVIIPQGVTSIGSFAFNGWQSNDQPLVIPNSVTSIVHGAFNGWQVNTHPLVIPDSVTSIGFAAFHNWQLVPYIEIQATTPPTLASSDAFYGQNDAPIYVPDESVDDYKEATNWVSLADRIFPVSDKVVVMGDILALETANMIKSITRSGSNLFTITYYDDTTSSLLTLAELKTFIGEATQSLSGLMSATDKQRLDVLHALLEEDTENNVVDSINEVLAIFNNYPEGADLVTALAGKVDKVSGKGLSTNDLTNALKSNYDTAYGWGNHAVEGYLKSITKAMVEAVLTGTITTHNHDGVYEPANSNIQSHISSTSNPHSVTKTDVGLGNVDNTSDLNKPISTAQQTALDNKVDKVSGKGLSTNDLTNTLKTNYDTAYTHSQTAHAPSNAQKNSDITKAEIEAKLTGQITTHNHDDRYYTETEIDTKLVGKADATHTHTKSQITDFPTSMPPTAHSTDLLTSGTLGIARGGTGRTDGYAVGVVETRASVLTKIWTGTQAQYDAIGTKDANTLYFIT